LTMGFPQQHMVISVFRDSGCPRYAANAAAGVGPGSHGSVSSGASPTVLSDPQRPHRRRAEDETILQFSQ